MVWSLMSRKSLLFQKIWHVPIDRIAPLRRSVFQLHEPGSLTLPYASQGRRRGGGDGSTPPTPPSTAGNAHLGSGLGGGRGRSGYAF